MHALLSLFSTCRRSLLFLAHRFPFLVLFLLFLIWYNDCTMYCCLTPIQTSLLVSGMWGLLLFKELTDPIRIGAFFASAVTLLVGAFLLSFYG